MIVERESIERIDLRRLAEAAGARFARGGRGLSSPCPLHGGDNPAAFHLYRGKDGRQRWHCFTRCPAGHNDGDAVAFYIRWKRVDFATAVRELGLSADAPERVEPVRSAAAAGSEMWQARAGAFVAYAQEQLWGPGGRRALGYLHEARGLRDETIRTWGLGYVSEDWRDDPARWGLAGGRVWCPRGIVIPAYRAGALRYVKVRRPLPGDALAAALAPAPGAAASERPGTEPGPKYAGLRGGRAVLYGEEHMQRLPDLLLVEGEFDAMLAWQEARGAAGAGGGLLDVATLGGALQAEDAWSSLSLSYARRIFVAYDADAAGHQGARRFCAASPKAVQVALPVVGEARPNDITEFWRAGGDLPAWVASLAARES